jgi:hypothetical protein
VCKIGEFFKGYNYVTLDDTEEQRSHPRTKNWNSPITAEDILVIRTSSRRECRIGAVLGSSNVAQVSSGLSW